MMKRAFLLLSVAPKREEDSKRLFALVTVVVLAVVILTACDFLYEDPRVKHLFPLFITTSDLPSGWWRTGGGIGDAQGEGVISCWVQFQGVPEEEFPSVLVSQELADYSNPEQATRAYAQQLAAYFPTKNWVWPDQIEFHSQADQFHLACLKGKIRTFDGMHEHIRPHHACTAIGQYGSIVSVLHANVFENEWLTFEDLQRLLETADTRLASQS